jgi:hypothetical protein
MFLPGRGRVPAPESVRAAYSKIEHLVIDLENYVSETLKTYAASNKYLFFGRRKTYDSLAEKLEGGRFTAWSKLDDLYACTLVVPTIAHEESVLGKLGQYFDCVEIRSRATAQTAPDVFRFDTTRFYGRLREESAVSRPRGVQEIIFEVQMPTVFEYAWITVTHDLVYKGAEVDWKKLRLAAQLKAAVEQIETVIGAFSAASLAVPTSSSPEIEAKQRIVASFRSMIEDGIISANLEPASWRRFSENIWALVKSYDRNPRSAPDSVDRLIEGIRTRWSQSDSPPCPDTGTLIQLVVSFVASEESHGKLDKFCIVDSTELRDLYGLTSIPLPFNFDLPKMSEAEETDPTS